VKAGGEGKEGKGTEEEGEEGEEGEDKGEEGERRMVDLEEPLGGLLPPPPTRLLLGAPSPRMEAGGLGTAGG